ncbi:MAG: UvrD-helicase domain-containing protein [Acidimicrobiales bacterium]
MSGDLFDTSARRSIVDDLDRTLFVEAGAGSGKTTALVGRIVALVVTGRARLGEIAAITFTEAAARELRNRVREQLELAEREIRTSMTPDRAALDRCQVALEEADTAAISTLHSFAQRVLSEHPIAVGIPPRVEVLDEVQSLLEFERRWSRFLDQLLEREDLTELLLRSLLLDIKFNNRRGGLRAVATVFNENWDRLDAMAAVPIDLAPLRWTPLLDHIEPLLAVRDSCVDDDDKLAQRFDQVITPALVRIRDAATDDERLRLVNLWKEQKVTKTGQKGNWDDVGAARDAIKAFNAEVEVFLERATNGVLRALASEVARFTLGAADERRADGRLEFHDLLVLARRLLRTDDDARRALHDRYRRLLLDEFQDTDPIQIELAALIASSVAGTPPDDWSSIDVDEGRLFFVGDPKQSIYRFRRASIETFAAARSAFGRDVPLTLSQNFRTVEPILDFVNGLFGELITEEADRQPAYQPLAASRAAVQGIDQRPTILGGPHPDDTRALELRQAEAADVAAVIAQIMDRRSRWLVHRGARAAATGDPEWDLPKLSDIVILLPTRTSLGVLQDALERNHVPYRADTGSLVFDSQEVRDVLSALRAIDDPADEVAVVAALRSPLYGCGDDDLHRWRRDGGHWDYRVTAPDAVSPGDPVRAGLEDLYERHQGRWWVEPSTLIQSLIDDRRTMLLALDRPRPRDTWRRLRYLLDQARAFSEAGGGDLRSFLDWVGLQGADGARSHEPILAEPDDDSVRIMTIHASKGLEFPIVVVSGLTTAHQPRSGRQTVLFDGDTAEIRLRKAVSTDQFDRRADLETEMDGFEKTRLLYVACTRARDHLVVSAHHTTKAVSHGRAVWSYAEGALGQTCRPFEAPVVEPGPPPFAATLPTIDDTAEARQRWVANRSTALAVSSRRRVLSATSIAQDQAGRLDVAHDPEGEPEPAPVRRRGRAGSAIGRAVHAVLQTVDFADPGDLPALARTHAHIESVPWAESDIEATVRHALESPSVAAAVDHPAWKELYVATGVGDRVLEGYIDLLVEHDDGLVVVDYKTDAVSGAADIERAVRRYRWQAAAYAVAVEKTTARPVRECRFVFCGPDGATEHVVADLGEAMAEVVEALTYD